jgi:2'-5' RNA ligase
VPTSNAAELRLFLALWPEPAFLPQLLQHADGWSWPASARRTRPERLHVTLHFLGNVAADLLPSLRTGLLLEWGGGDLFLDRATVWPGGIAVLEATQVPPALAQLHAALGERLTDLGVATELRPYRPHVTLARKAFGAKPPQLPPLRWQASGRYALVRTVPGRGYETLQAFG